MPAEALKLAPDPEPEEDPAKLRSPFTPTQMKLMGQEMSAAGRKHGDNMPELVAELIFVAAKWSARAARLYASDRDAELREDTEKAQRRLADQVEQLERQVEQLRHRVEVESLRSERDRERR